MSAARSEALTQSKACPELAEGDPYYLSSSRCCLREFSQMLVSVVRKTSRFFVILREAKDPSLNVHWPALCKYYFSRGGLKLMQRSFLRNGMVAVRIPDLNMSWRLLQALAAGPAGHVISHKPNNCGSNTGPRCCLHGQCAIRTAGKGIRQRQSFDHGQRRWKSTTDPCIGYWRLRMGRAILA